MRDAAVYIMIALVTVVAGVRGEAVQAGRSPVASAPSADLDASTQRSLAMAIAKWRGEDFKEAGIDLARLINTAKPDGREAISANVQAVLGMSLAELAADVHWRAAITGRRGPAIRLEYVTDYEKPVLMARMATAYEAALRTKERDGLVGRLNTENVAVPRPKPAAHAATRTADGSPRSSGTSRRVSGGSQATRPWYETLPPASQPAGLDPQDAGTDYAVIDWLGRPEQFKGSTAQAKVLAGRTAYATSLLNERLRLDPEVSRDRELKRQILVDKQRLSVLAKRLSWRIAHPSRSGPDRQAIEAERARREEFRKRLEEQQKAHAEEVLKAQQEARKWQTEQDEQAERKPGLFDWMKPKSAEEKK